MVFFSSSDFMFNYKVLSGVKHGGMLSFHSRCILLAASYCQDHVALHDTYASFDCCANIRCIFFFPSDVMHDNPEILPNCAGISHSTDAGRHPRSRERLHSGLELHMGPKHVSRSWQKDFSVMFSSVHSRAIKALSHDPRQE